MSVDLPRLSERRVLLLIVGINRGLASEQAGLEYAGKNNHFFALLYESGLTREKLEPAQQHLLVSRYSMRLVNLVDRATRSSSDLTLEELRKGGEKVARLVEEMAPLNVVFNGKGPYEKAFSRKVAQLGLQRGVTIGGCDSVWVMPSSSARVSHYQFEDKLALWKRLCEEMASK